MDLKSLGYCCQVLALRLPNLQPPPHSRTQNEENSPPPPSSVSEYLPRKQNPRLPENRAHRPPIPPAPTPTPRARCVFPDPGEGEGFGPPSRPPFRGSYFFTLSHVSGREGKPRFRLPFPVKADRKGYVGPGPRSRCEPQPCP